MVVTELALISEGLWVPGMTGPSAFLCVEVGLCVLNAFADEQGISSLLN